jgi:hypothetical protein
MTNISINTSHNSHTNIILFHKMSCYKFTNITSLIIIMRTNKPLLLVAIILMMPAIILALKVEPTSDEQITAVVFGILSAIVSYLSRD